MRKTDPLFIAVVGLVFVGLGLGIRQCLAEQTEARQDRAQARQDELTKACLAAGNTPLECRKAAPWPLVEQTR
jgi:hypothetical protein